MAPTVGGSSLGSGVTSTPHPWSVRRAALDRIDERSARRGVAIGSDGIPAGLRALPPPLWWLAVACCIEQDRIPLPVADDVLNKLSPNYRSCRCRGDNAGAVRADLVVLQDHHAQPDMGPRRADAARRARRAGASPQHATRRAGPRRRRGNIGSAPATLRSRCCLRRTRATCAESCADMVNERPGPCGRTLVRLATEALCDASSVGLWTRAGADGAPTGE